jgi:hypothetical protein
MGKSNNSVSKQLISIPFKIASGLSTLGTIIETYGAIVSTIVALGVIWSGVYLVLTVKSYNKETKALIEKKECLNIGNANTQCKYTISFEIENPTKQKIKAFIESSEVSLINLRYKQGDVVDIVYMDNRPTTPRFKVANRIQSGYSTILSGCYLILCYWVWVWMVRNSKTSQIVSGYSVFLNQ